MIIHAIIESLPDLFLAGTQIQGLLASNKADYDWSDAKREDLKKACTTLITSFPSLCRSVWKAERANERASEWRSWSAGRLGTTIVPCIDFKAV